MDKTTDKILTRLYKEYAELTAEIRAMQEEIRLLKNEAQDDQRPECKRVMFVPRSEL